MRNEKNNAPIRALSDESDVKIEPGETKEVERQHFEHFITHGDARVIEQEDGEEPDQEEETEGIGLILRDLPHLEDVEIDQVIEEYGPHLPTIQENLEQDFLEEIDGIGPAKAEEIMDVIDDLDEEVPEEYKGDFEEDEGE